jgi:hypothetical protein
VPGHQNHPHWVTAHGSQECEECDLRLIRHLCPLYEYVLNILEGFKLTFAG